MGRFNLLPGGAEYFKRVLSTEPANLIAYWPLDEAVGSVARDLSPNKFHGASVGVTLGEPGIGDGRTAYGFDGSTDYVNVYSTGLANALNAVEGTLLTWFAPDASVYTSGVETRWGGLRANENNGVYFGKTATNNQMYFRYIENGTARVVTVSPWSQTTFYCAAITFSAAAGQMKAFISGVQQGSTQTVAGTWVGALAANTCVLGASDTVPANPLAGRIAHGALWSKALTGAQIAYLSKV